MDADESRLWEAYRNTLFQATSPIGLVSIQIGECTSGVVELLRRNNAIEWAFITAHNPHSELLTPEVNRGRHAELEADVGMLGLPYFPGEGIGTDPSWLPETSLLILGLTRDVAIELGARYGQNAIVHGRLGHAAELVDCR